MTTGQADLAARAHFLLDRMSEIQARATRRGDDALVLHCRAVKALVCEHVEQVRQIGLADAVKAPVDAAVRYASLGTTAAVVHTLIQTWRDHPSFDPTWTGH